MQRRVERELADSDAALFVLNGEEGVGAGDRFIAELLKASSKPVLIAVNKGDRLNRSRTMTSLLAAEELGLDAEIFPISAKTGEGVEPLVARLAELMPEGPLLFPSLLLLRIHSPFYLLYKKYSGHLFSNLFTRNPSCLDRIHKILPSSPRKNNLDINKIGNFLCSPSLASSSSSSR